MSTIHQSLLLLADGDATAWLLQVAQSLSVLLVLLGLALMASWFSLRYIPNNYVGIVEKLWSAKGSVPEGQIIALNGEAGFQVDLLARRRAFWPLAMAISHS